MEAAGHGIVLAMLEELLAAQALGDHHSRADLLRRRYPLALDLLLEPRLHHLRLDAGAGVGHQLPLGVGPLAGQGVDPRGFQGGGRLVQLHLIQVEFGRM